MSTNAYSTNAPATPVDLGSLNVRDLQALIYREIGIAAVATELFGEENSEIAQSDMHVLIHNLREIQRAA